jgi:hypothetical protein
VALLAVRPGVSTRGSPQSLSSGRSVNATQSRSATLRSAARRALLDGLEPGFDMDLQRVVIDGEHPHPRQANETFEHDDVRSSGTGVESSLGDIERASQASALPCPGDAAVVGTDENGRNLSAKTTHGWNLTAKVIRPVR